PVLEPARGTEASAREFPRRVDPVQHRVEPRRDLRRGGERREDGEGDHSYRTTHCSSYLGIASITQISLCRSLTVKYIRPLPRLHSGRSDGRSASNRNTRRGVPPSRG